MNLFILMIFLIGLFTNFDKLGYIFYSEQRLALQLCDIKDKMAEHGHAGGAAGAPSTNAHGDIDYKPVLAILESLKDHAWVSSEDYGALIAQC